MKKLVFILAIICSVYNCHAQTPEATEHSKMLSIICRDFKVDQKHAEVIVNAIQYNRGKILAIMTNKSMSPVQKNSNIAPLITERQNKIKAILTTEQQQRLKELEMQQKMKQANHPPTNTTLPFIKN